MEFHSLLSDWYAPMAGSFKVRGTVRVIVIDKRETLVLLLRNLHNVTLMGDMELHNDNDCKATSNIQSSSYCTRGNADAASSRADASIRLISTL
jgi:hypothetical protein